MSVGPNSRLRLRLKHPAAPQRALQVLGERTDQLHSLPGRARSHRRSLDYIMERRDGFIMWVEDTEVALSELAFEDAVVDLLHTARYWAIRGLVSTDARPIPLIDGEIRSQVDKLARLRVDLEMRLQRARSDAFITVLDTNTLLHYEPPGSIPWPKVMGHPNVRLVILLRVLEEVDAKKYDPRRRYRDRARSVLSHLSERVGTWGDPFPLMEGVSLEVLVEPGPRERPSDADEEILDTARELWDFSGRNLEVKLITNDIALRMRALATGGIAPLALPDEYRRDTDAEEGA